MQAFFYCFSKGWLFCSRTRSDLIPRLGLPFLYRDPGRTPCVCNRRNSTEPGGFFRRSYGEKKRKRKRKERKERTPMSSLKKRKDTHVLPRCGCPRFRGCPRFPLSLAAFLRRYFVLEAQEGVIFTVSCLNSGWMGYSITGSSWRKQRLNDLKTTEDFLNKTCT